MIVIATGFIPPSQLFVVLDNCYVGKQPVAWKEYCEEYWLKEPESIDRCTGHHDITEILLKMALNTIQSILKIAFCLTVDHFWKQKDTNWLKVQKWQM